MGTFVFIFVSFSSVASKPSLKAHMYYDYFCLLPKAKEPINYLSCCSCSGSLINLLLGCTNGLNLTAD